jgi:hypothetical protein
MVGPAQHLPHLGLGNGIVFKVVEVFGMLQKENVFSVMENLKVNFAAAPVAELNILPLATLHIVFLLGVM